MTHKRIMSDLRQYDVYRKAGEYVSLVSSFVHLDDAILHADTEQELANAWRPSYMPAEYIVVNRAARRVRYSAKSGESRFPTLFGLCLQTDDEKIIHPLTWQYLYQRWVTRGIGPQRQIFRREPNREQIALNKLNASLWDTPIVTWA